MHAREIHINAAGFHAAMEALLMDDPYPGDALQDGPSRWLQRALYAYEWAKRNYRARDPESMVYQGLPRPGEARHAVLVHESAEQE